jgi:hypothetical protein
MWRDVATSLHSVLCAFFVPFVSLWFLDVIGFRRPRGIQDCKTKKAGATGFGYKDPVRETSAHGFGAPVVLGVPPDVRSDSGYALLCSGGDPAATPHLQ